MGFSKTILKTNHDIEGSSAFLFHYNRCNLDCYKCFNKYIINDDKNVFTDDEILDIIKENQDFVDYLIFSGGEITLKPDIVEFLTKVKHTTDDCKIIIYTNGTNPDVLEKILDIVDGIHLDIKTNVFIDDNLSISNKIYGTNIDNNAIIKSINLVYKYNKGYSQFRTVKYPLNNDEYYDRLHKYITTEYPLIEYKQNPFVDFE